MDQISNVLQNYSQGGQGGAAPTGGGGEVEGHFNQVAAAAPTSALAGALSSVFRSDQTPPFGQMVGQLFGNSNGTQRAGLLNTLLSSGAGAGILSQLQGAGVSMPPAGGGAPQITPEQAAKISPEMVQQAAAHAEQHDPSIVDRVSELYAQHPQLINTLGMAAMSMAMSQIASRR